MTITMYGHDRRGLGRNGGLYPFGIQIQGSGINIDKYGLDAVPQQRMSGGDERIRRGDHFAGDSQRLQCSNQRDRRVGEQRNMFHPEILTQRLLQLLMEWPAIRQYLVGPDLLQIWNELRQWRQIRLGDVDRFHLGWSVMFADARCLRPP